VCKHRDNFDELYRFSFGIFKLEFKVCKLVCFALFLYGLWHFIGHEIGIDLQQSLAPQQVQRAAPHMVHSRPKHHSSPSRRPTD